MIRKGKNYEELSWRKFSAEIKYSPGMFNAQIELDTLSSELVALRKVSKILRGYREIKPDQYLCKIPFANHSSSAPSIHTPSHYFQPVADKHQFSFRNPWISESRVLSADFDHNMELDPWQDPNHDALYDELLDTAHHLSRQSAATVEVQAIADRIEGSIELYLQTGNYKVLFDAVGFLYSFQEEVRDRKKTVISTVRCLVKKKFKLFKRDLRRGYRNLIRFLFKNMDANTEDGSALFSSKQSHFITFKKYFNHVRFFRANRISQYAY